MASTEIDSTRTAVLVDFGGVLTSSVHTAFEEFGASIGVDPRLPIRLLASDDVAKKLLSDHESGRIDEDEFSHGFAERLGAGGVAVDPAGLVPRMMAGLTADPDTLSVIEDVRAAGVPVALVSNAFGRDCYNGFDLQSLADVVVISSEIGVRKPSRKIYQIACDRLGVQTEQAVMIDDLQQNLDGAARLGIAGVLHTGAEDTRRQLAERFGIGA